MNPHITLLYNPILRTVLMSYPRPPNMHTLNLTLLLSSLAVRVGIITKHNYVGRNNMWVRGGGGMNVGNRGHSLKERSLYSISYISSSLS